MKKLTTIILSLAFLTAFMPLRHVSGKLTYAPDTTWKPYIVVLRNECCQQSANLGGITVIPTSGKIDNQTNITLYALQWVRLIWDGTNWNIIGQ